MIFDAIRESHDVQRDLCRRLTASRSDMAARQLLFLQLKVELMAHAAAEERHLYVPLLMEDGGLHTSRHALQEHHEIDELLQALSVRNKMQTGWMPTAKKLSLKVRHHLKEEESKFFQVAGRLLSETKKKQLARKYTREIVRMRGHYVVLNRKVPPPLRALGDGVAFVEYENAERAGAYWLPARQRVEIQATSPLLGEGRAVVRIASRFLAMDINDRALDSLTLARAADRWPAVPGLRRPHAAARRGAVRRDGLSHGRNPRGAARC